MKHFALFEIQNLKRRYGDGFTLDIPSLTIEQGKAYGFVGPNGSGKSTFLRILASLDDPDEGQVLFHAETTRFRDPSRQSERKEHAQVTMLLQEPYLLKRSVFENIAYGLRVRGKRRNLRSRVHESLMMVGLEPHTFSHRKWSELSGGEAQRVALAARLILTPEVLILDEPTASVDRVSAQLIRETIKTIRRTHNTTLLIASHDMTWLHGVCDEILKMQEGRIMGSGEENILTGPWLPASNGLWEMKLPDGQRIRALPPPQMFPPLENNAVALLDSTSIIVTTERPDHVSAQNILSGLLAHMYTFEHSERVKLDIQIADLSMTCSITRSAARSLGLLPGLGVWVVFKASSLSWQ
jgi:tungstate transport system ATP-binding protein